jgi:hypothetical protein
MKQKTTRPQQKPPPEFTHNIRTSISMEPELLDAARARARAAHRGKLSRYFQTLIRADVEQPARRELPAVANS